MDGGRGGGRGKGKKAKAKKKAAAAAAAAATQAQAAAAAHKKPAAHGGKKASAQAAAVSVSVAQAEAPGGPHEQAMSKAKRKRLKKAEKLRKKSPVAASAAAASPKTKTVAVLTPPPPLVAAAAAAAKPHVVSLSGGKKKKRKRSAAAGDATAAESEEKKEVLPEVKKTAVVVGHSSVTSTPMSTSPAGKGKSVTPTTASAKRKLAQVGSVALKRQEQHVGKEGDAKLTAASPKSGVVASPRKSVKKMKVKADAPAVKTVVTKTPTEVGPNGESQAKTVKLRAKAEAQLEQKKSVSVSLSSATASLESEKSELGTRKRNIVQAGTAAMPAPEQQQVLASKEQQGKTCAVPRKTAPEMIATTTPLKATDHAKTQLAATVVSTTAIDKLAVVRPTPSAKGVPDVSPAPARIEPTVPTTSGESFPSQPYGTPSTVASTAAHVEATIATGTVTAITGASSTQATKTCASSPSLKVKVSSPVPLPCGLKRRRSTDLASANIDALPPPAKKQSGVNEAVVTIKPRVSQQTEPREKKIPSYTPNSSSDQVSSSSQEPAIRAAQRERPAHTPAMLNKVSPKSNCPAEQLTPSVELTVPIVTHEVVRPLTATMPSAHTNQAWLNEETGKLKSIVKRETASRTTAPTKTERRDCLSAKTSSESTSKSINVDIVMDSHAYVQKMMSGELEAHRGSHPGQPSELTVALPPRPQNAWGASFGMIPPSNGPSSVSRTSTTPLSSWFLSKGCANFIKQVHFPDDDDNDSSDDDGITTRQPPGATRGIDKASPKRRASFVKKNSFLESLKTQSNWRSWYGHVDMHNLLDPPLAHIPEKLQMHESTPLQLPEAAERRATTKKANDLEMLEADIRREKQRGTAFSEQLLMMLQGKTVSGKLLEEEYKSILQQ